MRQTSFYPALFIVAVYAVTMPLQIRALVQTKMSSSKASWRVPQTSQKRVRPVQKKPEVLLPAKLVEHASPHEPKKLIEKIKATKNRIAVTVNKEFKRKYLKSDFFAEYDSDIDVTPFDYSVLSLPFLLNVITIVWISGENYFVEEMDTELYYSLIQIKKVFQTMYPKISWNGELYPLKLVDHILPTVSDNHQPAKERTAILYSGGIDSTSTALAHLDKKQLLITAWGHWDIPLNQSHLWYIRKRKTEELAQKYGNEASFIKSNYSSFLKWEYLSSITPEIPKWRLGAVEGLGWAGLTAPLLLAKGYPVLRIASSHTWLYPYPAASSPYVDNNIALCGLRFLHDQYELSRSAKIAFIVKTIKEKQLEIPFLKICPYEKKNDKNCLTCRKCVSSIIGFYAVGEDPKRYGMPISLYHACTRALALIAPTKLNCYTILYFKGIQERIRERIAKGEKIPKELLSILSIDLDKKIPIEADIQEKINRKELQRLLPAVQMPVTIDGILVDNS